MAAERYYPSKRDLWLVILIWASVVGMLFAGVQVWQDSGESVAVRGGVSLFMLVMAVVVVHLIYNTGYAITRDSLQIRCGVFRKTIPLAAIEEVMPSRSLLSGPALSLDRLNVRYSGSRFGVLISPEERKKFLRDLASRCPTARIEQ